MKKITTFLILAMILTIQSFSQPSGYRTYKDSTHIFYKMIDVVHFKNIDSTVVLLNLKNITHKDVKNVTLTLNVNDNILVVKKHKIIPNWLFEEGNNFAIKFDLAGKVTKNLVVLSFDIKDKSYIVEYNSNVDFRTTFRAIKVIYVKN